MNDSNKDSSTVATGEPDTLALADALDAMQPAFAADRDKLTRAAAVLRRMQPLEALQLFDQAVEAAEMRYTGSGQDDIAAGIKIRECRAKFEAALGLGRQPQPLPKDTALGGRWLCLACKSSTPGRHGMMDDGTPCTEGRATGAAAP